MRITWRELWPESADIPEWSHSGIAVTDSGDVVFAEPAGGGLILLSAATGEVEHIRVPLLEIHGIYHSRIGDEEFLWLADPGFKARSHLHYEAEIREGQAGRISLATLEFEPLRHPGSSHYDTHTWQPTSVVQLPGPSSELPVVVVADGYGASVVHLYRAGRMIRTLDAAESGLTFRCPHGLAVDTRGDHPTLVVADRGNRRLVVFTLDGEFVRVIEDDLLVTPSSLAVRGDDLLVTELDGALLAVDADDAVRALVLTRSDPDRPGWPNTEVRGELRRPELGAESLNSPHGLAVTPDGRILLTEWIIGGRQLELTVAEE